MFLTIEEAEQKWCPLAFKFQRDPDTDDAPCVANIDHFGEPLETCCASRCMMWRWKPRSHSMEIAEAERTGWCGLAPRPVTEEEI